MKSEREPRAALWATVLTSALLAATPIPAAEPVPLAALTGDDRLLVFSSDDPASAREVRLRGIPDPLCGIDFRPATGKLYGVTYASEVYVIDPESGRADLASTLIRPFDGRKESSVDFTPMADRLRLMTHDGQNLRVHADIGATAIDGPLRYAAGDPSFGARPEIAATAYTHNLPETSVTEMYDLDSGLDLLVKQDPPNEGILTTVGPLGIDLPKRAGFEITTDASGGHRAFAAFRAMLYAVDLSTGGATPVGTIGGAPDEIVSLSIVAPTWESP